MRNGRVAGFFLGAFAALVPAAASAAPSLFGAGGDVTYLDDAATGALTVVADPAGATSAAPEIAALTTQPGTGTVFGIDLGNFPNAAPDLISFDAAGHVATSTPISYLGNPVPLAEGLSFAPNGKLYVTFRVDEPAGTVSGHLGVIDPATAVIAAGSVVLLSHGTQNDGDALEFVGNTLVLADTTLTQSTALFTVDLSTGVLTTIGEVRDSGGVAYEVADLAWDGRHLYGESFTGNGSVDDGRLVEIDLANARATVIGPAAGRQILDGLTVATINGGGGGGGCHDHDHDHDHGHDHDRDHDRDCDPPPHHRPHGPCWRH